MLGWLHRKAVKAATAKQAAELEEFLSLMREMNSDEIAAVVLMATQTRLLLETKGYNLLEPTEAFRFDTNIAITLTKVVQGQQAQGDKAAAAATMVWLFTVRTAIDLEIRSLGRQLWRELSRGFPQVHVAYWALHGVLRNFDTRCLSEYDRIPAGLEPDVW